MCQQIHEQPYCTTTDVNDNSVVFAELNVPCSTSNTSNTSCSPKTSLKIAGSFLCISLFIGVLVLLFFKYIPYNNNKTNI